MFVNFFIKYLSVEGKVCEKKKRSVDDVRTLKDEERKLTERRECTSGCEVMGLNLPFQCN
jgi:hypothetical protein